MDQVVTTPRLSMSPMRRLRIFESHDGRCCHCGGKIDGVREKWIVEHLRSLGLGGPDADENCAPAHEHCRRVKDKDDLSRIAKAKRQKAGHLNIKRRKGPPMPGTKASGLRKRMDGTVERRAVLWTASKDPEHRETSE